MIKITKSDLQLVSGIIVTESKLNKESKLSLLNFIQHEASIHQLMALLLDGKVASLNESSKQIIEDRFKSSKYPKYMIEAVDYSGKRLQQVKDLPSWVKGWARAKGINKSMMKIKAKSALGTIKANPGKTVAGIVAALVAYKVAQAIFSKAHRECITKFSGKGKTTCLANARIRLSKQKISALNSAKAKCSQAKDSNKCQTKISEKIKQLENKITKNQHILTST